MLSRLQSAGLLALAITAFIGVLCLATYLLPLWTTPIWAVMWFSSPLMYASALWFREELMSNLSLFPTIALLIFMPYLIYGAVVGFVWPVASGSIGMVARALLRRILAIYAVTALAALCLIPWMLGGS